MILLYMLKINPEKNKLEHKSPHVSVGQQVKRLLGCDLHIPVYMVCIHICRRGKWGELSLHRCSIKLTTREKSFLKEINF